MVSPFHCWQPRDCLADDWCQPFSGYHLYPSRRQPTAAFAVPVDALRYRG
jgi:hypothetical protein